MARIGLRPEPAGKEFLALTEPPDWDQVFGSKGPLELELGSGMGGFALEYCRRHPETRYVAFEWRKKYAREMQHRARKHGIGNLRVIEADARAYLPRLFRPGSLAAVRLHFPDPWWKRAHQKRVLLTADFTQLLLSLLAPGGLFDLRTDVGHRAHQMLATLEAAGLQNPLGPGAFHPFDPEEVPSTRERRYLASGQPVYRARLRKPLR
ncbi:MAG: tRNA (guanine-N7)-methyltransferase [Myxococcales bacterium]|nr:tRNA (guanine-N7)-methyltransferase [Myxococcales bacterium]